MPITEKQSDKPSDQPSGDAEFQRWFAEQDPFGNSKSDRQTDEPKNSKGRLPASGMSRFGIGLAVVFLILGVLAVAFFIGVARSFH